MVAGHSALTGPAVRADGMSPANPSGPWTASVAKSTRDTKSFAITFRYDSGWSAGSPTYSSREKPDARANDTVPSAQRAVSSS
jgi:hypothetical protein